MRVPGRPGCCWPATISPRPAAAPWPGPTPPSGAVCGGPGTLCRRIAERHRDVPVAERAEHALQHRPGVLLGPPDQVALSGRGLHLVLGQLVQLALAGRV